MSEMHQQPNAQPSEPASDDCAEARQLRAAIGRLTRELESRQADPRPLPTSVMRAYQALIDKHFVKLAAIEAKRAPR